MVYWAELPSSTAVSPVSDQTDWSLSLIVVVTEALPRAMSEPVADIEHFYRVTGRMCWQLEVKIRAFENLHKLTTVISGSATLAMAGTIVAEFIAADAGIGYSIRIALYQGELAKILIALFLIGITLSVYQGLLEALGPAVKSGWSNVKEV